LQAFSGNYGRSHVVPVGKLLVAGSSHARRPTQASRTSEAIFQDRFRRLALLVATRLENFDFTATGYVVALTVGMLLSTRFPSPAHWTPPRLMLRPPAWRSATPP